VNGAMEGRAVPSFPVDIHLEALEPIRPEAVTIIRGGRPTDGTG
jgi:hypothetical protein